MSALIRSRGSRVWSLAHGATFNDNRQRVLDATDVVRLVGDHVTLKPKGREFVCLCPFHDDRNPSMYVVPAKQIYHCFVCGAGGNAIDFVMKFHGMPFREALEFLANRAGVELTQAAPRTSERADGQATSASTREQLAEANAFAASAFRTLLAHADHGAQARAMIERRGISAEMVESFGIGVSPDRWDGLLKMIEARKLPLAPFIDAGLLKRRGEGSGATSGADGYYDTFRNRLMFPIHDQIGRIVAFGGRKIRDEDEPKYLNSPETRLFDKGSTLFGLRQGLRSIQAQRHAIITEGYLDVIACHQAGFTNVVATLGTALTPKHATILRRLCESITLLFDGDEAGQRAADRALEVFFTEPVDVRVATLPGGVDPDDLLKSDNGPAQFEAALRGAQGLLDFRFERLRARLDQRGLTVGSVGRAAAIESEIDRLVELGLRTLPPVRQQTVVQRLARIAGVDAGAVVEALRRRGLSGSGPRPAPRPTEARSDSVRLASAGATDQAFGCLLVDPMLAQTAPEDSREILERVAYGSPLLSDAAEAVSASLQQGGALRLSDLLLVLTRDETRSAVTALVVDIDRVTEGDHERVAEHWKQCVRRARLEETRGGARPGGFGAGTGQSRQAPTGDEEIESGVSLDNLQATLERARRNHERLGGNPLAMPRPSVGAG